LGAALERMAAVPGVQSVAAISQLPLGDPASGQRFTIEGRDFAPDDRPQMQYRAVSPSYVHTMRIVLKRGRALTDDDREDAALVVVGNEAAARTFWPNDDPIGTRIRWSTGMPAFDAAR